MVKITSTTSQKLYIADKCIVAVENGIPLIGDGGFRKPFRLVTGVFSVGSATIFTEEAPEKLARRIVMERERGFVKLDTYENYELWIVASAIDYISSPSLTNLGLKREVRAQGRFWFVSELPTHVCEIVNKNGGHICAPQQL